MTCPEVEELIDLYVIGALTREEGREVAVHLDGCPGCRAIEARVREVAQLMRLTVEQPDPSPALRSRILALAQAEAGATPVIALGSGPPWWRAFLGWLSPAPVRMAAAFAVIPLVLSAWLAVQVVQLRSEMRSTETALAHSWETSQNVAEIIGRAMQHGGQTVNLQGMERAPDASGMLYYAPSEGEAVLVARGLPELSQGKVYQCWLQSGERRMNAGTFYRENDGRALVVIKSPMRLDAVEAVGVTEEPHGGSTEPRGDRYIWGRLRRG